MACPLWELPTAWPVPRWSSRLLGWHPSLATLLGWANWPWLPSLSCLPTQPLNEFSLCCTLSPGLLCHALSQCHIGCNVSSSYQDTFDSQAPSKIHHDALSKFK